MGFHRVAAYGLLAFALFHPVSYAADTLVVDPIAAWHRLTGMLASNRLRTGVLALAGLIILVGAATIRSRPFIRYEYWRLSHGLLAILVAVLTLQHVLAVGTYSADYPLRAVWFLFAFVAVTAVGLVYFSHNRHIEQKCFTVALVRPTGVSLWRQSGRAWTELLLPNFTKCETARPI